MSAEPLSRRFLDLERDLDLSEEDCSVFLNVTFGFFRIEVGGGRLLDRPRFFPELLPVPVELASSSSVFRSMTDVIPVEIWTFSFSSVLSRCFFRIDQILRASIRGFSDRPKIFFVKTSSRGLSVISIGGRLL